MTTIILLSLLLTFRGTGGSLIMVSTVSHFTNITLTRKKKMKRGLHAAVGEDPQLMSSSEALSWGGR